MSSPQEWERLSFQEAMELTRLPDEPSLPPVQKFMSRRPAWVPGDDLPWESIGAKASKLTTKAFGGVVYAMAPLAAARVVEEEDDRMATGTRRGIHVSES